MYDDHGGRGVRTGSRMRNCYKCVHGVSSPDCYVNKFSVLLQPIYFNLFLQESIFFLFKWGSQGENMSGTLMFLKRRKAIALHGTPSSLEFRAEKELKNPFRPFKIVFEL